MTDPGGHGDVEGRAGREDEGAAGRSAGRSVGDYLRLAALGTALLP
ncbi:ATPase, partial [Marinitenerispora sediminis]